MAGADTIVTLDVIKTRGYLDAARFWQRTNRAWHRPRHEWVKGRRLLGVQYTIRGEDVHPPRKPLPGFLRNWRRKDGWGRFPDLRRLVVIARWESEADLDAFRAGSPYPEGAEVWHARLRPVKSSGKILREDDMPDVMQTRGSDDLPGVALTWNSMWLHRMPKFSTIAIDVAGRLQRSPGARATFVTGNVLRPLRWSFFTVSCWERLGDMVAFAYKDAPHRESMDWYGRPYRFGEPWFGRFVIERSEGTLAGRDPFDGVELAPQRAAPGGELVESA